MGEALRDYRREELVISTKLFWGGDGTNDVGLSPQTPHGGDQELA